MSEEPKVIWVDYTEYTETYEAVTHTDCGGTKYHHDDTMTSLKAKAARLEAALEAADDLAAIIDNFKYGEIPLELFSERQGYRNALRAIALDTTTATCDNTREGE